MSAPRAEETRPRHVGSRPPTLTARRGSTSMVVWTVVAAAAAALFGWLSQESRSVSDSPVWSEIIHRLGGAGTIAAVVASASFSTWAVFATAFGISVVHRAGRDERAGATAARARAAGASRPQVFFAVVGAAVFGATWLLVVFGAMFTLGRGAAGEPPSPLLVGASLNHAPAVWTVVGMTAIAWSLRPVWSAAGWGLLVVFAALGPLGRLVELPSWMIGFSPFARIARMPVEEFNVASTIGLTAGSCVLVAIAAFNYARRDVGLRPPSGP